METITIEFKNGLKLTLKNVDSFYIGDDKIWRFFNDLNDLEVIKDPKNLYIPSEVEFDGDTVFIKHDIIKAIFFN